MSDEETADQVRREMGDLFAGAVTAAEADEFLFGKVSVEDGYYERINIDPETEPKKLEQFFRANTVGRLSVTDITDVHGFKNLEKAEEIFITCDFLKTVKDFGNLRECGRLVITSVSTPEIISAFPNCEFGAVDLRFPGSCPLPNSLRKMKPLAAGDFRQITCGTVPVWLFETRASIMEPTNTDMYSMQTQTNRPSCAAPHAWWSCLWYWAFFISFFVAVTASVSRPGVASVMAAVFTVLLVGETLAWGLFSPFDVPAVTYEAIEWTAEDAPFPFLSSKKLFGLPKPHPNVTAVVSAGVQALQLASFAFNPSFSWPSGASSAMQFFSRGVPLANPLVSFKLAFWVAFCLAFLLTPAVYIARSNKQVVSILSFAVPILFIPVSSGLYSAFVCTNDANVGKAWLDAAVSAGEDVSGGYECWVGGHLVYCACAILGLAWSHCTMIFLTMRLQGVDVEGQLSLKPKSVLVETELKFLLVVLTLSFSSENHAWMYIGFDVGVVVCLVATTVVMRPAPADQRWFDVYRVGLLCAALEATLGSIIVVGAPHISPGVVFALVVVAWIVTLGLTAVVCKYCTCGRGPRVGDV